MKYILWLVAALILLPGTTAAQEKKENVLLHPHKFYRKFFPNLKIKRNPPDSSYIKTYPYLLSSGIHVLSPAIGININPTSPGLAGIDAQSKFRSNISDVIGISATYKLVSFGFSFLSQSGMNLHPDYAPSRYRTATIRYNGAAESFQFKYIRVRGFTDINHHDTSDPSHFFKRPDLTTKEFQFELIHNFSWKKFSYSSALSFSQRQVKSHAGFLLKAGAYYSQLSGDTSVIQQEYRPSYGYFTDVNIIRSFSIRVAPGFGANLVLLRKFYFSVSAFTSYDLYLYKYLGRVDDKVPGKQTFVFVWEGKASLGYQSKRFYAGVRYEMEQRIGTLSAVRMGTSFAYTGIEAGYRFDAPRFIQKFYKKTMPPGM